MDQRWIALSMTMGQAFDDAAIAAEEDRSVDDDTSASVIGLHSAMPRRLTSMVGPLFVFAARAVSAHARSIEIRERFGVRPLLGAVMSTNNLQNYNGKPLDLNHVLSFPSGDRPAAAGCEAARAP